MTASAGALDPARIEAELGRLGSSIGRPLTVLAVTASTNDDARRLAAEGAPHGAAVLAEAQTAGRGRGSRRWHSPAGENLYLSIVWRPTLDPARLAPLALAVGLGVARAVDAALGAARARIKWPNDVYVDDRKIAGVLVEAVICGSAAVALAGVGLNVNTQHFPEEIAAIATSLALASGRAPDRDLLAARLIHEIGGACAALESAGPDAIAAELDARDWLKGKFVGAGDLRGVASGIDRLGRLQIFDAAGVVHAIVSGEVSLQAV